MNKDNLWPIALTIVLASTIISSVVFIFYSKSLNTDLVTKDYYQKGLQYQEQINRMVRSDDPAFRLQWKLLQDKNIMLSFPADSLGSAISGSIIFYRPSDASKDFTIPIAISSNNHQIIDSGKLSNGYWIMKVFWNRNSTGYYFEDRIVL